jgi:hypothetical protein
MAVIRLWEAELHLERVNLNAQKRESGPSVSCGAMGTTGRFVGSVTVPDHTLGHPEALTVGSHSGNADHPLCM